MPTPKNENKRQNVLDLPAQGDEIIKASYVQLKVFGGRTMNRYFVLRKNFCLYSYMSDKVKVKNSFAQICFRTNKLYACCRFLDAKLFRLTINLL